MPFQKGNKANPNGARKSRQFYNMLNVALSDEKKNPRALRKIADKLIAEAQKGEAWAIKELADRLDGKPAQMIVGDEEQPLTLIGKIERVIVENVEGSDT